MGIYLNPGGSKFYMSCNAQIYIDKSTLISKLNPLIETEDPSYQMHLNKHMVLQLNMQNFLEIVFV